MYSLTKYMNGHADVVMGAVVINDEKLYEDLRFMQNGNYNLSFQLLVNNQRLVLFTSKILTKNIRISYLIFAQSFEPNYMKLFYFLFLILTSCCLFCFSYRYSPITVRLLPCRPKPQNVENKNARAHEKWFASSQISRISSNGRESYLSRLEDNCYYLYVYNEYLWLGWGIFASCQIFIIGVGTVVNLPLELSASFNSSAKNTHYPI